MQDQYDQAGAGVWVEAVTPWTSYLGAVLHWAILTALAVAVAWAVTR